MAAEFILYRGDRSPEARAFRLNGIMTKLMRGGSPAYVATVGLWEAARAHVQPLGVEHEQEFYRTTPFLSFSESYERAKDFAKGKGVIGTLVPCSEWEEDTVIFHLDVAGMVQSGQEGVFMLEYLCDYSLARPEGPGPDELDRTRYVGCDLCGDGSRQTHRLQLIRVPTFLKNHPEHESFKGARESAERDREWLVYPIDFIPRLRGIADRVPFSPIWRDELFRVVSSA